MSPWKHFLWSFVYAGRGIALLFRSERNARVHLAAAIAVLIAAAAFRVERWEWCLLFLCIALVTTAEAINTSIERLLNRIHPDPHPDIAAAKDLAAAAVLIAAAGAAAIGFTIFLPRLSLLLSTV